MVSAVMGVCSTRTPRLVSTAQNYDQLQGPTKRATEMIELLKECRQAPEIFAKRALLCRYPKDTRSYLIHSDEMIESYKDMLQQAPLALYDRLNGLVLEYEQWSIALLFRTADLRRSYGYSEIAMQTMDDKMRIPDYVLPGRLHVPIVRPFRTSLTTKTTIKTT